MSDPSYRRRSRSGALGAAAMAALLVFLLLLSLSGCATTRPPGGEESWREYERGVEDAKYPRPERVSHHLTAITTFTGGLVWDDTKQKLLMVTWTRAGRYTQTGEQPLPGETWLTAAPFMQRFCRALGLDGSALEMRLRQRLGLPPSSQKDVFVEMWVDPAIVFRPCPDPEINDRECQVNLTTGGVDRASSCPWSAAQQGQVSAKVVKVTADHLDWMCKNWQGSYQSSDPHQRYPWTALGYTYDWAPSSRDHIGDSEYVAPDKATVVVKAIVPTAEYCRPRP
jgi:hypothetical protein